MLNGELGAKYEVEPYLILSIKTLCTDVTNPNVENASNFP